MIELTNFGAIDSSTDFSAGLKSGSECAACSPCENSCVDGCIATGCRSCSNCSQCCAPVSSATLTDALSSQLITNVFNSNESAASAARVAATTTSK